MLAYANTHHRYFVSILRKKRINTRRYPRHRILVFSSLNLSKYGENVYYSICLVN